MRGANSRSERVGIGAACQGLPGIGVNLARFSLATCLSAVRCRAPHLMGFPTCSAGLVLMGDCRHPCRHFRLCHHRSLPLGTPFAAHVEPSARSVSICAATPTIPRILHGTTVAFVPPEVGGELEAGLRLVEEYYRRVYGSLSEGEGGPGERDPPGEDPMLGARTLAAIGGGVAACAAVLHR